MPRAENLTLVFALYFVKLVIFVLFMFIFIFPVKVHHSLLGINAIFAVDIHTSLSFPLAIPAKLWLDLYTCFLTLMLHTVDMT